jgi:hypothetical protein
MRSAWAATSVSGSSNPAWYLCASVFAGSVQAEAFGVNSGRAGRARNCLLPKSL